MSDWGALGGGEASFRVLQGMPLYPQRGDDALLVPTNPAMKSTQPLARLILRGAPLAVLVGTAFAQGPPPPPPPLGPPPVPPQNPLTPEKAVLGKALFWDEQLSHDDTVACGTCHIPSAGGGDPRDAEAGRHPGPDGILGTGDDRFGSLGVVRTAADGDYAASPDFGFAAQATGRATPTNLMGAYFTELFWDGRASGQFRDPLTNQVVINQGGALESQSLHPILDGVEMAGEGRTWDEVVAKLERVEPLALATDLPSDLAAAMAMNFPAAVDYADLFEAAFGTAEITPVRIGLALASYQRTLVPNQTPWDAFTAGNQGALTPAQQNGLGAFVSPGSRCNACHGGNLFADNQYHNLGLRPIHEDRGRQEVTGLNGDRGRFKTPSLRNVGLRGTRFFHTGAPTINTIAQLLAFYDADGGQFQGNKDPLLNNLTVPPQVRPALEDFLVNGLTDPRVAAELPPFDRPRLASERAPESVEVLAQGARAGSGGYVPKVVAMTPAHLGNPDWRLGVYDALGGAQAVVTLSTTAPGSAVPGFARLGGGLTLKGSGPGQGHGTWHQALPEDPAMIGLELWLQWQVRDAGAQAGVARSPVVHLTIF